MEVFHVGPGGRYAVRSGRLMDMAEPDPAKRDLTMRRAAIIPGVLPAVEMHGQAGVQGAAQAASQAQDGNAVLAQLEKADYGVAGRADAPRLFAFIDPLCSFSVRLMEALRPHIAAGRIQVAMVPLALIDHETNGRSTPAAQTLLSQPSEAMDSSWRGMVDAVRTKRPDSFAPMDEGRSRLARNMALAASLQVQATPTLVWRQSDGTPRAQMGGQDLDQVIASLTRAQR
jgi:thiol:disulfide interchange protein DsbG